MVRHTAALAAPAVLVGVSGLDAQATLVSSGGTTLDFTLGLGGDLRLSSTFDARLSAGFGDVHGIALRAVWLN